MPTAQELIEKLEELKTNAPETRSRRVQVLMTPSMHDTLKAFAETADVSVNEIINLALSEFLKGKE